LLLLAVKMVSKAKRFKYIQDKMANNSTRGYAPDFRVIDLEINWDKLPKAIEKVDSETRKIPKNELDNLRLRDALKKNLRNAYDILCADQMLAKYPINEHFFSALPRKSDSWVWKCIL